MYETVTPIVSSFFRFSWPYSYFHIASFFTARDECNKDFYPWGMRSPESTTQNKEENHWGTIWYASRRTKTSNKTKQNGEVPISLQTVPMCQAWCPGTRRFIHIYKLNFCCRPTEVSIICFTVYTCPKYYNSLWLLLFFFHRKIWLHISDPVPRFLKLQQIQEALAFDAEMQDDAFNVAVQALFEDEVHRFGGTDFLGWRHFLNQDFAVRHI